MDVYSDDGNESDSSSSTVSSASTKSTLLPVVSRRLGSTIKPTPAKRGDTTGLSVQVDYEPEYGEVDLESIHIETTTCANIGERFNDHSFRKFTSQNVRDKFGKNNMKDNEGYMLNINAALAKKENHVGDSESQHKQDSVFFELQKISLELKAQSERLRHNEDTLCRREKKVEKRAAELNEFAVQLSEREKRIVKLESSLLDTKKTLEDVVHSKTRFAVDQCRKEHEDRICELEREVKEKNNEIKRMQSNFSLLKEACDKQKNRICELEKSNEQLHFQLNQSNARLKNLLRGRAGGVKSSRAVSSSCSSGASMTSKGVSCAIIDSSVWKKSKEISDYNSNLLGILELQVNWLCEVYLEPKKDEMLDEPWISTCKKMLPFVINVIISNPEQTKCQLSYLKLVYWCLHFLYKCNTSQTLALPTASIHRLSETLARTLPKKGNCSNSSSEEITSYPVSSPNTSSVVTSQTGSFCSSSDASIRLFSTLVLIKTCSDTLKLIAALNILKNDLKLFDLRKQFFALRATGTVTPLVNGKSQPLTTATLEIFVQLCLDGAEPEFPASVDLAIVEKLSQTLKNDKPDTAILEKLMVILQKLCKARSLKKSFDEKKLVPPLQQLWLKANNDNAFLALSVRSVLLAIGSTVPRLQ